MFVEAKELEVGYPELGIEGVKVPKTTKTPIEEYIRYIFALSIRIAGFIAFGVMVYGGIRYLISAGSPGAIAEARKTIFGGFLGIIILLSSHIILRTINPQILSTKIEKEQTIYCGVCTFDPEPAEAQIDCNRSITITDADGSQTTIEGTEEWNETCKELLDPYRKAGVYLIGEGSVSKELVWINGSLSELTNLYNEAKNREKETIDLNDRVQSIRFGRNNEKVIYGDAKEPDQYCAILFEYGDFEGAARVICEETGSPVYSVEGVRNDYSGIVHGASSILVFQLDKSVTGKVTPYTEPGFQGESNHFDFKAGDNPIMAFHPFSSDLRFFHEVYSIDIEGNILVLLCGEDFYEPFSEQRACLPFYYSHPDILLTTMGACEPWFPEELPLYAITSSCVESIAAFKIKY